MEGGVSNLGTASGRYQVPDELMKRLHAATEQFSAAKKHLDAVLATPVPTMREKDSARAEIRQAGQELERLDEKIHQALQN